MSGAGAVSGAGAAGFRPCAGIALLDGMGRVLAGRRAGGDAWQMPQGGIDGGESPEAAALRELREETGVAPALARVLLVAPAPVRYDVPEPLRPPHWQGRFRGQALTWVVLRFLGTDRDVDVAQDHAEFDAWAWMAPKDVAAGIVEWKRPAYAALLPLLDEASR